VASPLRNAFLGLKKDGDQTLRAASILSNLGLPLADPLESLPGVILFAPWLDATRWLANLAATTVVRILLTGLQRKNCKYEARAMRLLQLDEREFRNYRLAFGWLDKSFSVDERKLEAALVKDFRHWCQDFRRTWEPWNPDTALFDGQRPDGAFRDEKGRVILIEAKLGLARSMVRTGLSQAAEYLFHLRNSNHPAAVASETWLLVGSGVRDTFGAGFDRFAREAASLLNVGLIELDPGAAPENRFIFNPAR
jgi:hypothetical protein